MKNLLTIVFICLTSLFGAVNLSLENVDTNAGTLSVIMENDETVGDMNPTDDLHMSFKEVEIYNINNEKIELTGSMFSSSFTYQDTINPLTNLIDGEDTDIIIYTGTNYNNIPNAYLFDCPPELTSIIESFPTTAGLQTGFLRVMSTLILLRNPQKSQSEIAE